MIVILSLPRLPIALLGGYLTSEFGLTVRVDRRVTEPAVDVSGVTSDAGGHRPPGIEWQVSH